MTTPVNQNDLQWFSFCTLAPGVYARRVCIGRVEDGVVLPVNQVGKSDPFIYNLVAINAGTEYSQALPLETKEFLIKSKEISELQIYWATGATEVLTVPKGGFHKEENLTWTVGKTIFLKSSRAGATIEIHGWK